MKSDVNTNEQLYSRTFFQLFIRLYVLEITLIELFCLVRDVKENVICLF